MKLCPLDVGLRGRRSAWAFDGRVLTLGCSPSLWPSRISSKEFRSVHSGPNRTTSRAIRSYPLYPEQNIFFPISDVQHSASVQSRSIALNRVHSCSFVPTHFSRRPSHSDLLAVIGTYWHQKTFVSKMRCPGPCTMSHIYEKIGCSQFRHDWLLQTTHKIHQSRQSNARIINRHRFIRMMAQPVLAPHKKHPHRADFPITAASCPPRSEIDDSGLMLRRRFAQGLGNLAHRTEPILSPARFAKRISICAFAQHPRQSIATSPRSIHEPHHPDAAHPN